MAQTVKITAKSRPEKGANRIARLRKTGQVPGILYGHKETPISISTSHDELFKAVTHGTRLVDLETDGKLEKALIREVQWDFLGKDVIHVDFSRVSADEKIQVTVPLELKGVAPGVLSGGVLDMPMHSVQIECLALDIPESIKINITELQIGSVIHVKDLVALAGIRFLADADAIVVHVIQQKAEVAAPVEGAVTEGTEPEVIKKAKPVAEEDEE
ncbi:MAG: 50S ribosomal protein L25 [Gemmataceae bacterium]|nr:50S ribosomal protein L25 [Gemmataceae bacterium]